MPRESAKYFAVLLQVVQGQHLLEHEILPEHKCFVGSGSKLLLPDVFFFFKEIWLSCQRLENSRLQRQLVMNPVSVLRVFLGDCQSTLSLNTAYDHRFGFCNYFVPCFQTHVLDLLVRLELTYSVSAHARIHLEVYCP